MSRDEIINMIDLIANEIRYNIKEISDSDELEVELSHSIDNLQSLLEDLEHCDA